MAAIKLVVRAAEEPKPVLATFSSIRKKIISIEG
jgi:hypothetical protein